MGQVVHKEPQDRTEVMLSSSHCDLYGNGRLGVTVTTRKKEKRDILELVLTYAVNDMTCTASTAVYKKQIYNLWMRETMVLNAAWMSAVVQVQTTGRWWFCSISERY